MNEEQHAELVVEWKKVFRLYNELGEQLDKLSVTSNCYLTLAMDAAKETADEYNERNRIS